MMVTFARFFDVYVNVYQTGLFVCPDLATEDLTDEDPKLQKQMSQKVIDKIVS